MPTLGEHLDDALNKAHHAARADLMWPQCGPKVIGL
jgi:hypothetical protein